MIIDYEKIVKTESLNEDIDLSEVVKNYCTRNAALIVSNVEGMRFVEGFLMTVTSSFELCVVAHVWNEKNGVHYDITYQKFFENRDDFQDAFYLPINAYSESEFRLLNCTVPTPSIKQEEVGLNGSEKSDEILANLVSKGFIPMDD